MNGSRSTFLHVALHHWLGLAQCGIGPAAINELLGLLIPARNVRIATEMHLNVRMKKGQAEKREKKKFKTNYRFQRA